MPEDHDNLRQREVEITLRRLVEKCRGIDVMDNDGPQQAAAHEFYTALKMAEEVVGEY